MLGQATAILFYLVDKYYLNKSGQLCVCVCGHVTHGSKSACWYVNMDKQAYVSDIVSTKMSVDRTITPVK